MMRQYGVLRYHSYGAYFVQWYETIEQAKAAYIELVMSGENTSIMIQRVNFAGVDLDESSILRNTETTGYPEFILDATETPFPNLEQDA